MAEHSNPADVAAIDQRIASLGDWRGETLARVRQLIHEALPDVVETMKWKKPSNPAGVPVFERAGGGILCIADAFKAKVKVTFGRGARLPDPRQVFNNGLGGNAMRAIDLARGDTVDAEAFKELVRAAAADRAAEQAEA